MLLPVVLGPSHEGRDAEPVPGVEQPEKDVGNLQSAPKDQMPGRRAENAQHAQSTSHVATSLLLSPRVPSSKGSVRGAAGSR